MPKQQRHLLLVAHVRPDGTNAPPIPLQIRGDLPVRRVIASLVARWHLPTQNQMGIPLTYRLTLEEGERRPLPEGHRLWDLHLPPGKTVCLEAMAHPSGVRGTSPPVTAHPADIHHRVRRRRILRSTGRVLLACSLTGLFSGISTAWAQHQWEPRTPVPVPAPTGSRSTTTRLFAPVLHFTAHHANVQTLAWSPQGTVLGSGDDDARLLLWTPDGAIQQHLPLPAAVRTLAWSPNATHLVAGSGNAVVFLTAQTGAIHALTIHRAPVSSVVWSSHITHPVVSGSLDHQAIVWDTQQRSPRGRFTRHTAPIEALAITPDGTTLASASQGGVIRVWNIDTVKEIHEAYQDAPIAMQAAAFAPDGMHLAVGGSDGIVRIWTQSLLCQQTQTTGNEQSCLDPPQRLQAHTEAVRTLAFSPDGSTLATGGDDAQVILWDVTNGFQKQQRLAHAAPVLALSWSPHTSHLATAAGTVIQLWARR